MGNPLVRFCEGLGGNWGYRELPCLLDVRTWLWFDVERETEALPGKV
jgi:hypothetical protein